MKRLILLLCFVTLSCTVANAQVDTLITNGKDMVVEALTDSGKLTAKMVYDDAKAGIIGLAKALKSPVEHVYKVLVMQQVVKAITYLIVLIIGLSFFFIALKGSKNTEEKWHTGGYDPSPTVTGIMRWAQIVLGIISICAGVSSLQDIVAGFVNPEYGAIKDIFEFVRGSSSTPQ